MDPEKLKFHRKYMEQLSRVLHNFGENQSVARVARFSIELLLSERNEHKTGHEKGRWGRMFWFELNRNLIRSIKCTAFNIVYRIFCIFLRPDSNERTAVNLLGKRYKKITVPNCLNLFLHRKTEPRNLTQLFSMIRLSSTNSSIVMAVCISAFLVWLDSSGKKQTSPNKFTKAFNHRLFTFANNMIVKEIEFLRKLIKAQSIQLIINSGDSSISGSILALAARSENICYLSINHGVVSDPLKRTIIPSYASHQGCWSSEEVSELEHFEKAKIDIEKQYKTLRFNIGIPTSSTFKLGHRKTKSDHGLRVLIAFGGHFFSKKHPKNKKTEQIRRLAQMLKLRDFKVFVSLHPRDAKDKEWQKLITQYGWINSTGKKYEQPIQIDAAVGANTSLLSETAELGIPSFHLLDFSSSSYDYKVPEGSRVTDVNNIISEIERLKPAGSKRERKGKKSIKLRNSAHTIVVHD